MDPGLNVLKAVLWGGGALLSFGALALAGREVSTELNIFELMMYRSLIGIGIVLAIGLFTGTIGEIRTDRLSLHFVRNVIHFVALCLWFYAVSLIPLAQLFALEFTTPIWVSLFAPLVLGERMTITRVSCAVVGFIGTLIIARPGVIAISPGVVAAALCAVGMAGSLLATTFLVRIETTTSILFWLNVIQAGLGVACVGLIRTGTLPSARAFPWVIVVSCASLLGNYCVVTALRLAPAMIVAPIDFAGLPLVAIFGIVFYAEPIEFSVFIGAAVIFGANYFNVRAEKRSASVPTKKRHDD
jgi:drug/metabolite transporter (DMT)-like permease